MNYFIFVLLVAVVAFISGLFVEANNHIIKGK